MAQPNSLQMLLELEQKREDKLAQDFAQAQQALDVSKQRLRGLEQYRLDYLQQLNQRGAGGIQSQNFGQYHAFIGKLDVGIQQLSRSIITAQKAVVQRRQLWLQQRQKREAVAHLLEQRRQQADKKLRKREQIELDEFSANRLIRSQLQKA